MIAFGDESRGGAVEEAGAQIALTGRRERRGSGGVSGVVVAWCVRVCVVCGWVGAERIV